NIALDGLSFAPLIADLTAAYTARRAGGTPAWAPLPVDYADYARWQHELLDSGIRDSDLGFWEGVLEGAPAVPGVPLDRSGRQSAAARSGSRPASTVRCGTALGAVARGIDATPFMVLHSAVAVLLSAITGTPDTLVGTAESGRNDPLLDELVGMFVGTVALRAHVHGDATFPDLVDAVRASDIDAFVHATTPFDVVQERCGGVRLQAMLAYESFADPALVWPGLEVRGRAVPGTDARSDLEIAVRETAAGLEIGFVYDSSVLDRRTVQGWASLLGTILDRVAVDPHRRIADLVTGGTPDVGPVAPRRRSRCPTSRTGHLRRGRGRACTQHRSRGGGAGPAFVSAGSRERGVRRYPAAPFRRGRHRCCRGRACGSRLRADRSAPASAPHRDNPRRQRRAVRDRPSGRGPPRRCPPDRSRCAGGRESCGA
ncbi:hypothetical protein GS498_17565, partial [Rhodococcus hoagii]|nr:hypothetical protein [Prescottella equi]